jgi:hypothetical protein
MNARKVSLGFRTAAASAALGAALLFASQSFAADTSAQPAPPAQTQAPAEQNNMNTNNSQSAQPGQDTTQSGQTQSQAAAPKMAKTNHEDRIEARIKQLHSQLHITQAQEQQWNDFAQVMRDNAAQMDQDATQMNQLVKARADKGTMTAVDDLKAYEQIADARADESQKHADGLKKLVPAFETLYDSMSDSQKKVADNLFNHARRMHEQREQHKT